MGWTCFQGDKAAGVAYLREQFQTIKVRDTGRAVWFLGKSAQDGETFIGVALMETHKGEVCIKFVDESMGPCEVNCPLSWLDESPDRGSYSTEWRERVRKYHEEKKTKAKLSPGNLIEYGGNRYRLDAYLGRRGWRVIGEANAVVYRLRSKQLADARLVA